MTDIAVIILAGQEKLHIRRCLERLKPLEPRQIFVVESQPSDGTHEIAVEMGAVTAFNRWPGLYGKQFNWALDNLPIEAKWGLRLDADEYLTDADLVDMVDKGEIKATVINNSKLVVWRRLFKNVQYATDIPIKVNASLVWAIRHDFPVFDFPITTKFFLIIFFFSFYCFSKTFFFANTM